MAAGKKKDKPRIAIGNLNHDANQTQNLFLQSPINHRRSMTKNNFESIIFFYEDASTYKRFLSNGIQEWPSFFS
ncbi:MAG: hypothetical protein GYA75_06205 [Bacteroidales bacterium]|jgi:hypothetical protein|nr:hypothetical protein [Bacteroidales bacterium]OQC59480.1 MAG: hypothetical protein BWX51_01509 [Bacteroidetes bacterium ADurb.Bin012]HPV34319.1 hypothetical protein [Bacteroidales bacterium]HRS33397.1 hypothetical protein [Bacteroidales bacterium]